MISAANNVFRHLTLQLRLLMILLLALLPPGLSRARDKTPHFEGRIIVCMIQLEYAQAEHLASVLEPFMSPEGTITPHGPTNTLIIKDRAPVVNMLSEVIKGKPGVRVSEPSKTETGVLRKDGYLDR